MNAERLLAHLESIVDGLKAIDRFRQFILDLGIRGKLVEQDQDDEPASILLARLKLYKDGDGVGKVTRDGVEESRQARPPFDLPPNWIWTDLGSIGSWGSGSTPPRGTPGLYGGSVSWLKSGELNDNRQLAGSEETITRLALQNGSFRLNRPGDVLFAMYGATIGKVAILAEQAVTNQAVCACTPYSGVVNEFLYFFLKAQREQFRAASEGGAQPNVSKVKIVRTPFPLPPTSEQHRIVRRIDELMTMCDRLDAARAEREIKRERLMIASFARLNAPTVDTARFANDARFALEILPTLTARRDQIRRLRQTILNLAVRGKLVSQDTNDEPASEILRRIAKENAQQRVRPARSKPASTDGDLLLEASLPVGWATTTLGTISRRIHYGYTASADATVKNVRMVRITDVQDNTVRWSSVPGCVIDPEEIPEYRLEAGDILIARTGGTVGKSFLVRDVPVTSVFASYLIRAQGTRHVLDDYVKRFLESPLYWHQLLAGARGTGQPNVNSVVLGRLILPLPPYGEQQRIVEKVNELMALCDRLETSLSSAENTRSRLLEALLADALAPASNEIQLAR